MAKKATKAKKAKTRAKKQPDEAKAKSKKLDARAKHAAGVRVKDPGSGPPAHGWVSSRGAAESAGKMASRRWTIARGRG